MPKLQKCDFLGSIFKHCVYAARYTRVFNDVCHYEYCQSAHKTVCYIPFHFRKKDCSLHEGGILGKYRISFCTTPRDSVDHYFSLYERRFVSWNLNKSLKRAIQETLDAGIRISFSLLFLFCCLI